MRKLLLTLALLFAFPQPALTKEISITTEIQPLPIETVVVRPDFDRDVLAPLNDQRAKLKSDCDAQGGTLDGLKCIPAPIIQPEPVVAYSAPTPAWQPYQPMEATSVVSAGNGYSYGYCTYHVKNRRPGIPNNWGNASNWLYAARASGYSTGSVPAAGAIAWSGGHVAYVESISGGQVTVSEMNWNGNWNRVTYRTTSSGSFTYIY